MRFPRWWSYFPSYLVIFLDVFTDVAFVLGWLPDTKSKLKLNEEHGIKFSGNYSLSDHLIILYQDDRSVTIGGRNTVYNLSLEDLTENKNQVRTLLLALYKFVLIFVIVFLENRLAVIGGA